MKNTMVFIAVCLSLMACKDDESNAGPFELQAASAGSIALNIEGDPTPNIPVDRSITLSFSGDLNGNSLEEGVSLSINGQNVARAVVLSSQSNTAMVSTIGTLMDNTVYTISLSSAIKSLDGRMLEPITFNFKTQANELEIIAVTINGKEVSTSQRIQNVEVDFTSTFEFTSSIDVESFNTSFKLPGVSFDVTASNDDRNVTVTSKVPLDYLKKHTLEITNGLKSTAGGDFQGFSMEFYTQLDSTFKFPQISDEELLTKVQQQTFRYFWDFAHPHSGLIRERNSSGDLVTIGGSGFGVMAIVVGIERGFITRSQGIERLATIVDFLGTADRFHGAWPHWMNGITGETIPFSTNDDGADLVETAFMIQGLLAVRQYLNEANTQELAIKNKITALWEAVEWDWFTQGGQDVLYWHWSPNFDWEKNLRISGWNESLMVYVLAASSPTYSIEPKVYHSGWARDGGMANGKNFYGIDLPLGADRGGPLFFSHYSFLGLDPRQLEDQYANYWDQSIAHSSINQAYCVSNPLNFVGYSEACWGLTASDNNEGYSAHSPNNDKGVITPTAAVSALPYVPDASLKAIRHFYYLLGDELWGEYGFYDAFNITSNWYARSYLAIDQGPIIIMIENYRTALLWDLFMKDAEITSGLEKLGFTSY